MSEIFLQCIADRREDEPETLKTTFIQRYFLSFYFWLDIISTVSLLLDLTWIFDSILDMSDSETSDLPGSFRIIAKTGRGARVGSRAGRLVRLARLFRTSRMFGIYHQTKLNMMNVNLATIGDTLLDDSINNIQNGQHSRADTNNQVGLLTRQTIRHLPSMPSHRHSELGLRSNQHYQDNLSHAAQMNDMFANYVADANKSRRSTSPVPHMRRVG